MAHDGLGLYYCNRNRFTLVAMKGMKGYLALAALMAMAAESNNGHFNYRHVDNTPSYRPGKGLPAWHVGEYIIHARNEKDAIKYAKKRGLYNGETPIKIEQK